MKVFSPFLNGDTTTSGSLNLPQHPTSASISNPNTGSLYHDTTDNVVKVYTGTQWQVVGEQAGSAAGPASVDVEYLLIAGGGGGGAYDGGGGGAGGYLSSSISSVTSGSSFTVTVGSGGAGQVTSTQSQGGSDSSIAGATISTITAIGGGKGGGYTGAFYGAGNGGSGGGGVYAVNTTGGTGTVGQGNDGGDGDGGTNAGGGGGAGSAGGDATSSVGGNGGSGLSSTINGTSVARAGGGGGAGYPAGGGSAGSGADGGGNGGANSAGTAGTANTGGGGGGSQDTASPPNNAGGSGGSGVAIFAYESSSFNAAGGITGDAGNGRKYHQFNSSGTLNVGNTTSDFLIHTDNLVMHVDAGQSGSRGTSTTAYDLSSYSNNLNLSGQSGGSLTDNPWWNCDGSGGLADFERNGASVASDVAHTGYGNMTGASNNAWTIEFWIRSTASGGNATLGKTIIGTNSGGVWATISIKGNKFNYSHADNGGNWVHTAATTDINDGSWHHCVLVNFSNETCNMFVDGVKEVSAADSGLDSGRYMKMDSLGRGYSAENTAMDIGQLRVYDASLTDAQAVQNYEATKTNFV